MELNFELIRVLGVLIGTGAAAWQDHLTSFIDDRIVFSMIGLGLFLNLITLDASFVWASLWLPILLAVAGYFMYRAGQLGGGDVLLFIGIALLIPFYPAGLQSWLAGFYGTGSALAAGLQASQRVGAFFPFFASVFVASSLLGLIGSSLQYAFLLVTKVKKLEPNMPVLILCLVCLAAFVGVSAAWPSSPNGLFSLVLLLGVPVVFLTAFRRQILRDIITVRVPVSKILSEDVVATEVLPPKMVKKYGIERVATESQMKLFRSLSRRGILKKVPVYHHLPRFAPYVLAGLVLTLLAGDGLVLLLYV